MKQKFVERKFRGDSARKIEIADAIIEDYQSQGLRLTLRQLYYVFVTRNEIENSKQSYKNLASLISDARLAGLIDWDAIEDRGRQPHAMSSWDDIAERLHQAIRSYRRERWIDQHRYVELWVEKDALAGVLEPLAQEYHVVLMVNKGYSSQSAMYEAAHRFIESKKQLFLLYLGDHDPSGEDMVRDIQERLTMFGVEDLILTKVALTMDQVEEYSLPPNPAKRSDVRYEKYVEKHGDESWELDALEPRLLQQLVRESLEQLVDRPTMNTVLYTEQIERDIYRTFMQGIPSNSEDDLLNVAEAVVSMQCRCGDATVAIGMRRVPQQVGRKLVLVTRSTKWRFDKFRGLDIETIIADSRPDIDGVFWFNLKDV